jgi:galactose mutarotase-like enzyme
MNPYLAYTHERNFGCRMREIVYRGHRCVTLENERLRVLVVADKGADLLEFLYKPLDLELLWHSYHGLRRAVPDRASSPLAEGPFREQFAGGWYEMLPNGPEPAVHRGAAFGFHGEATLLPWDYRIAVDDPERIVVVFSVRLVRMPIYVEKTLTLERGSSTLIIDERLTCEAGHPIEVLWGQHPTFGWPFIEAGCRVFLPRCVARVAAQLPNGHRLQPEQEASWPHLVGADGSLVDVSLIPGPDVRSHDFVRLDDLADGWYAIVNPHKDVGFALRWDRALFPTLGFWQVFRGGPDYPWYGQPYLIALEPACDLPSLARAAAHGTAIRLEPGAELTTRFEATVFTGRAEVTSIASLTSKVGG